MGYTGQSYKLDDGSEAYVHEGPLSAEEAKEIIGSGDRLHMVFAVPLSMLLECDYNTATDSIVDDCVFGRNYAYELEDWSYNVVGVAPDNILHMLIDGWIVEI